MNTSVRLAGGSGLVARRATELLFIPAGAPDLVEAFEAAPHGAGIDAITRLAEERSFEIDDFVAIDWADGVRVAVFGDVEVVSDHRSLPRLSASGAGTWVERSIRQTDEPVTIGVGIDHAQPVTDLRDGVVQAGGFSLRCVPGVGDAGPAPAPAPVRETSPSRPQVEFESRDEGESPAVEFGERAQAQTSNPSVPPEPVLSSSVAALADEVLTGTPTRGEHDFLAAPDDVTIVPDSAMRSEIDQLIDDAGARESELPPLPPLPDSETASSWQLVFADGPTERVDRVLVLGRKPSLAAGQTGADTRLVQLDCTQVSGRHLEVRTEGDGLSVTDLGSSNGSFVLTTGDGQLVRLEPGVPHRIDAGMIVQIGTKRFRAEVLPHG